MERGCRKIVIKRMVEQNSDYRLNPRLKMACVRDIPKFCSLVIAENKDSTEFEGKVRQFNAFVNLICSGYECFRKEYGLNFVD